MIINIFKWKWITSHFKFKNKNAKKNLKEKKMKHNSLEHKSEDKSSTWDQTKDVNFSLVIYIIYYPINGRMIFHLIKCLPNVVQRFFVTSYEMNIFRNIYHSCFINTNSISIIANNKILLSFNKGNENTQFNATEY